jgi:hypothetical protein
LERTAGYVTILAAARAAKLAQIKLAILVSRFITIPKGKKVRLHRTGY